MNSRHEWALRAEFADAACWRAGCSVLVLNLHIVILREIRSECCQPQRRNSEYSSLPHTLVAPQQHIPFPAIEIHPSGTDHDDGQPCKPFEKRSHLFHFFILLVPAQVSQVKIYASKKIAIMLRPAGFLYEVGGGAREVGLSGRSGCGRRRDSGRRGCGVCTCRRGLVSSSCRCGWHRHRRRRRR